MMALKKNSHLGLGLKSSGFNLITLFHWADVWLPLQKIVRFMGKLIQ